jgi:hypothetical protein
MESIFRIEVSELFHAVLIVEGINDFFVKDNMQKGYDSKQLFLFFVF